MKFSRILGFCSLSLIATPISGQFGLPKKDKGGTSFEELNELMKGQGIDGSDPMADMQKMMGNLMNDPNMIDAFKNMGQDLEQAMEEMAKLSPEEVQVQMESAMKMLTDANVVESVIGKKEEVLKNLKLTGMVSDEELAKFDADPAYFEEQMRGAFDQMQGLFSDPDIINNAKDAMAGIGDALNDPIVTQIQSLLIADSVTDTEIEELRLKLVQDPEAFANNPILSTMFMDQTLKESVASQDAFRGQLHEAREKVQEIMQTGMMPGMEELMGGVAAAGVEANGDIGIGAL